MFQKTTTQTYSVGKIFVILSSVLGSLLAYVLFIFSRAVPSGESDRGIFVFIGERLISGDRLYTDVFDNKDPLFYYLCALARLGGTYGEILLEHFLIIGITIVTFFILNHYIRSRYLIVSASIFVPQIVTPLWLYAFGFNTLPTLLLFVGIVYSSLLERHFVVGVLVGLTLMLKITMGPIAIGVALFFYIYQASQNFPDYRQAISGLSGFIFTLTCVFALLIYRGEFEGYIHTLYDNYAYSTSEIVIQNSTLLRPIYRIHNILVLNEKFRYVLGFQFLFGILLLSATFLCRCLDI